MSRTPTIWFRIPIAPDMPWVTLIPDAITAVRAFVTSSRFAPPTAAPSAAIFTRSRAFLLVIPSDSNDDSAWYRDVASESGENPTCPASFRIPSPRFAILPCATPAWVWIRSIDDRNFAAATVDATPIPMMPSVILFAAFVTGEDWKPFVHTAPVFFPAAPAVADAPSSSRFRVGPNPVVVGRIRTNAVASGEVTAASGCPAAPSAATGGPASSDGPASPGTRHTRLLSPSRTRRAHPRRTPAPPSCTGHPCGPGHAAAHPGRRPRRTPAAAAG